MQPLRGSEQVYLTCAFSPDGQFLAAGGLGHTVEEWDTNDPGVLARVLVGDIHPTAVIFTGYTPSGAVLATHARNTYHLIAPGPHRLVLSSGLGGYAVTRA